MHFCLLNRPLIIEESKEAKDLLWSALGKKIRVKKETAKTIIGADWEQESAMVFASTGQALVRPRVREQEVTDNQEKNSCVL